MSKNPYTDSSRRRDTMWPSFWNSTPELPSIPPEPAPPLPLPPPPRPPSSVYHDYVPPYLDPQRNKPSAPIPIPMPTPTPTPAPAPTPTPTPHRATTLPARPASRTSSSAPTRCATLPIQPSADWEPPARRGRDAPFPAPSGRRYPAVPPGQQWVAPTPSKTPIPGLPPPPDVRPPTSRIERGRGIVRSNTSTRDLRKIYFDRELQEWRPIPGGIQLGVPEKNWAKETTTETDPKNRSGLKKLGRGLVQVIKDLGNSKEKKDAKRRTNLAGSISVPLGTSKRSRR